MKKLFEKRVGASVLNFWAWTNVYVPGYRATWPLSKLIMYKDHLKIKIMNKSFQIKYKDIKYIKKNFIFGIIISHKAPRIRKYVHINGIFTSHLLFKQIKRVIEENKLKIRVKK